MRLRGNGFGHQAPPVCNAWGPAEKEKMKAIALVALTTAGTLLAAEAEAASAPVSAHVLISGTVTPLCSVGVPADGDTVFNLGTLVDTATGLLLPNLAATKTLNEAFCNALSNITVSATQMRAQSFTTTPPAGFTTAVNFSASASGWSAAPAVFVTALAANPSAVQSVPGAFAADIVIALSQFTAAGGPTLVPVADSAYQGTVTITVAIAT